jgi:AcrR family transcriptional regulator
MSRKIDHEQRKQEIARKALRLFSQVGYENVSLIMIAADTGISRTVLYRYFCSKREILDAAILTALAEVEAESHAILLTRGTAMEKIERICHAVIDQMFAKREFVVAVFDYVLGMVRIGADMNQKIRDYTNGTRQVLQRLVERAIRRGELPEGLIVDRISDAIYSEFESCAMRIVLNTERDSSAAKVRFSDILHAISLWK